MQSRVERLRVGPYRLSRHLAKGPIADRWVAVHEAEHSLHTAYRFKTADAAVAACIRDGAAEVSRIAHPHLLPVEAVHEGVGGSVWVMTPFTGNHDGLVTLASLVHDKGGRMTPAET